MLLPRHRLALSVFLFAACGQLSSPPGELGAADDLGVEPDLSSAAPDDLQQPDAAMAPASCFAPQPCPVTIGATPIFPTELVLFEDSFLFHPAGGATDLVYRTEGAPAIDRGTAGTISFAGTGGLIHAAQLRRATLRASLSAVSGTPELAIAHNGLADNLAQPNPDPGFKVAFAEMSIDVTDLKSSTLVASIKAVRPAGDFTASISWDLDGESLRVDVGGSSYMVTLPRVPPAGGFGVRGSAADTSFQLKKLSLLWQDTRAVALYDEYDRVYSTTGALLQVLPAAKLPAGMTSYITTVVDLKKARSFLFYGGASLNIEDKATIQGFAVRDLKTGDLDLFPSPVNGCYPLQGGGGLDGHAMLQSWTPPASICWLDWNAYDRGDRSHFVTSSVYQSTGTLAGPFVGFHDADSALDGSMVRYLRITEAWKGISHYAVHPDLARFASFSDQAVPQDSDYSHTHPDGQPTSLAVRDLDRGWYEVWAYLSSGLHVQTRGYNLFSNSDDWAGPRHGGTTTTSPYVDYANMAVSLTQAGRLYAPSCEWTPSTGGVVGQALHLVSAGANDLTPVVTALPLMPAAAHSPIPILW